MQEEWWPTVIDKSLEWMDADGLSIAEVVDRFRNNREWRRLMGGEDLKELERRIAKRQAQILAEDRRKEDLSPSLAVGGMLPDSEREVPRATERGVLGMLAEAFSWVFGVGVAELRTEWRRGPSRVLYEGDEATVLNGRGPDWLVCAVKITRADGREEILEECKIRALGRKPKKGYKGRLLYLMRLEIEGKHHDAQAMMRRAAAFALAYGGERSGMANQVELAKLNNVTKQAVQQQMNVIRRKHQQATGETIARIGGSGAACGRRRGKGGGGKRRMTKPEGENPKGAEGTGISTNY